ncbi:3(2),5-bisphosphate nucleotidase HAL2 [Wolfiporia cocos MD-104 SS10]|uniref:3'(2'),5'-bisphosphate nucleotidase n=1 Tax=Wolfiporia cocos (strain MD-104) TaxID=742152 RepID=A0A2H3JD31_WOLCO|nr:3(2),5-bisphosphate nucleotidase HAL2 [Wolfiporia cocos MD-104 SS10]
MSTAYDAERQVAVAAVRRACVLTSSVFNKLVRNETLTKDDKSPVTVGDFSAQALVNTMLGRAFPDDPIVGEEDSADLRDPSGAALRDRVVALANEALTAPLEAHEKAEWGIGGRALTADELLAAIDRGNHAGGRTGRMWTLDPIDGTKGFLRGEQYAVCLALVVDARVELGVIGCPNLPADPAQPGGARGCIFVAVRGQGAHQLPLADPLGAAPPRRLAIPAFGADPLNLLESVEKAHAKLSFNERVAQILGVTRAPTRMDSQAKYCALARGDGGVYLRMPTGTGYREKIWDHAPGSVLVEEAGGVITDSRGEPLDFGLGRTLGENFGVVAAGKEVHSRVLGAIKRAKEEEAQGQ